MDDILITCNNPLAIASLIQNLKTEVQQAYFGFIAASVAQLCLKNPTVRNRLGLPNLMEAATRDKENDGAAASEILIPIEAVPPKKLLELALKYMASGDQDKALILLRKTIEKDPEQVQALVAIGQILCSKKLFEEAAENFELAIPKLSYIKEEEIGLLVLSLFGAGVSRIWQGRNSDGIEHLKKIAELREPDGPMDKACYYRGLVMLGSTLFQLGEKSEAAKYLKIAATYDPGVEAYLKECEG
ncbi:ALBINO3-like protein 3, mitochondrial [Phalaenopsis equestris]|uniref:ALBINO3-like protein 3, mitochondrial n=1 Tax=Phalaenopsis equestris TaxID=78828 RepID=UPI0009E43447|nr:ALBINO3-like protein 3, mitochondrial [Phalaenopsis equestris]